MSPTYKLLIGVPGKSNAFAISEKLGLNKDIIENAKKYLKKDSIPIENIIKSMYDDKAYIEAEKEKISNNSKEIENLKKSLEKDSSNIKNTEKELIQKAKEEARNIILDAKNEVNETIKKISNTNNLKDLNSHRNSLNKKLEKYANNSLEEKNVNNSLAKGDIVLGMSVFIPSINSNRNNIITSF